LDVFVARQPILDRARRTDGYELLFRSGTVNHFDGSSGDQASLNVLDVSFFTLGLPAITGGKRAYVNFTRDTLMRGYATILPRQQVVVEILETVVPDDDVVEACRVLKQAGHTIALDDFVAGGPAERLVPFADIIKVDFERSAPADRARLVERLRPTGVALLAEKVETEDEFAEGVAAGYTYFQGYFLSRPVIISGPSVPAAKRSLLQLLHEIHRPGADLAAIEQVIKREVALTYKLLTYINSAAFGFRRRIETVGHTLAMLGEVGVKKWASVAALSGLGSDKPFELVVTSVSRARFCELLAVGAGLQRRAADAFLMGLFSMMDALLGRPLVEILDQLPVAADVRQALSGESNPLRRLLDLAVAYERGHWSAVAEHSAALSLQDGALSEMYLQAVAWGNAASALQGAA
jgi:EAL and modified HD-GYP domain-containing signal transduction protein